MSTPVYYFSGTGNSLHIAKRVCRDLGDAQPVGIAGLRGPNMAPIESRVVGLVFPLYFAGLPEIVADFVREAAFQPDSYIFALVAAAYPWSGYALHQLRGLLKAKGQDLSAGYYITSVENFLPKYNIPAPEEQAETAVKGGRELDAAIHAIKAGERHIDPDPALYLFAMYPMFMLFLHQYDRLFRVDERCKGCGICEKVCPVENIVLDGARPRWRHRCQFCMGCINTCPSAAIEWGSATKEHGRYRNPDVSLKELMAQKRGQSVGSGTKRNQC